LAGNTSPYKGFSQSIAAVYVAWPLTRKSSMRVVLKSTLTLAVLYLILTASLAFFIESELRTSVRQLMNGAAQLVGSEIAAALHKPSIKQLLGEKLPGN
jgi:hypothetical protein